MKIVNKESVGNFNKSVFKNGLTIISEYVPGIESFSAGVCINTGSRDDLSGKEGIAHFMEHSCFRHTKNRTSKQIANGFENLGAYSNAFTTKEITCFYVRAIKQYFAKNLELLADITLETIFVEKEIEKEKLIIIEEIKSYEDDPEEYICDLADTLVFAGTPLAPPIVGTQESVSNISYLDLEEFHKTYYNPANITISVAGNILHNEIIELAEKLFCKSAIYTSKRERPNTSTSIGKAFNSKGLELTIHRDIQQAHTIICKQTKGFRNEERYPLAIASAMFGDGMSSRLYQNLREKYGLAYTTYSSIQNYADCGGLYIYAATDENKVNKTITLVLQEMEKFITVHKPTKKELTRTKEQLKTATIIELESMSSRMQNLIKQEISVGRMETIPEIISHIDNITMDDIIEISHQYFVPDNWSKCLLLPK